MEQAYAMKTGHEEQVGRTLDISMRRPYGMTLALRPRQLRDEDKSCGSQPAHIRVIYRRISLLMSCLIAYASIRSLPGLRNYVKVSPARQTNSIIGLGCFGIGT